MSGDTNGLSPEFFLLPEEEMGEEGLENSGSSLNDNEVAEQEEGRVSNRRGGFSVTQDGDDFRVSATNYYNVCHSARAKA